MPRILYTLFFGNTVFKCQVAVKIVVLPATKIHTHLTDCFAWATKVVSNKTELMEVAGKCDNKIND